MNINLFRLLSLLLLTSLTISCNKSTYEVDLVQPPKTISAPDNSTEDNLARFRNALKESEGVSTLILSEEARQLSLEAPLKKVSTDSIATTLLQPLLTESIIFLEAEGVSKSELSSIFGSLDDPTIIIGATMVYAGLEELKNLNTHGVPASNLRKLQKTDLTVDEVIGCLGQALVGAKFSEAFIPQNMGMGAVKRFGLTAITTLGKRAGLGSVGTAIAVGVFINCIAEESSDKVTHSREISTALVPKGAGLPQQGSVEVTGAGIPTQ